MLASNIALLLILLTNVLFATQSTFPSIQSNDEQNDNIIISNDSLEQLIVLSDSSWLTDKKKSDSLITLVFNIISQNHTIDSALLADAYHMLGKVLINRRQIRPGIDTLKKSLLIKQLTNKDSLKSLAITLNYIGIGYMWLQKFDSTFYYCNKSKELLINNDIKDINLYNAFLNIAISYASLGQYNTAVKYFDLLQ